MDANLKFEKHVDAMGARVGLHSRLILFARTCKKLYGKKGVFFLYRQTIVPLINCGSILVESCVLM